MNGVSIFDLTKRIPVINSEYEIVATRPFLWFDFGIVNHPNGTVRTSLVNRGLGGSAYNLIQASSSGPTIVNAYGRRWAQYTASNTQTLYTNTGIANNSSSKITCIVVCAPKLGSTVQAAPIGNDTNSISSGKFGYRILMLGGTPNNLYADNYSVNIGSYGVTEKARANGLPVLVRHEVSSQQTSLYVNSKKAGTSAVGAATLFGSDRVCIGGIRQSSLILPFEGLIGVCLWYDRILGINEVARLERYLMLKYGCSAKL